MMMTVMTILLLVATQFYSLNKSQECPDDDNNDDDYDGNDNDDDNSTLKIKECLTCVDDNGDDYAGSSSAC